MVVLYIHYSKTVHVRPVPNHFCAQTLILQLLCHPIVLIISIHSFVFILLLLVLLLLFVFFSYCLPAGAPDGSSPAFPTEVMESFQSILYRCSSWLMLFSFFVSFLLIFSLFFCFHKYNYIHKASLGKANVFGSAFRP